MTDQGPPAPHVPHVPPEGPSDELLAQGLRPGVNPALLAGVLLAGSFAWAFSVLFALAVHRLLREETCLALSAVSALVLTVVSVRFGTKGRAAAAARNVARAFGIFCIGLAAFGGLFAIASLFGGDEERTAFWLWLFGTVLTAVALRTIRRSAPDSAALVRNARRPVTLRTLNWAVAVVGSLAVVFSPLRSAVKDALTPGDTEVSFPEPSDDDD